jgi:hypothetical protein
MKAGMSKTLKSVPTLKGRYGRVGWHEGACEDPMPGNGGRRWRKTGRGRVKREVEETRDEMARKARRDLPGDLAPLRRDVNPTSPSSRS